MNKSYYPKLALGNIKKNGKTYIPYIITSVLTVMMFYIIRSLSQNRGIMNLSGSQVIFSVLNFGSWVVAIFALVFLFYTNSFLMKQRKKEFGLYNILGMEKKHIAKLLAFETFFIVFISMILGLGLGVLLDKGMYLIILKILKADVALGFYISPKSILMTVLLFAGIYLLIYLNSVRQVYFSKPIELLRSTNTGEKEPKAKWLIAILGLACLGVGYYISLSIKNPVQAITYFFIAVILVIVGTYLVFTAGSIAFLKILRKNKNYYYKTKHFISVSGMIYRMKQNAVGLANICILVTMVLVMISSTSSLWFGMNDMIDNKHPNDLIITVPDNKDNDTDDIYEQLKNEIKLSGYNIEDSAMYNFLEFTLVQENNKFIIKDLSDNNNPGVFSKLKYMAFISLEDYNRLSNSNETLENNEVLFHCQNKSNKFKYDELKLQETNFSIKKSLDTFPKVALSDMTGVVDCYQVIVKDLTVLDNVFESVSEIGTISETATIYAGFDIDAADDEVIKLADKIKDNLQNSSNTVNSTIETKAHGRQVTISLYGSFLFLGVFLGVLFTIATILIIYYKQISEGYDDKHRFEIMQKVGMSHHEVKQTIHSQILTVFFLPLITAGIHVAFAFPVTAKILKALYLDNTNLFLICTAVCFVIFSIIYSIIYSLTAKTYYKIVSR